MKESCLECGAVFVGSHFCSSMALPAATPAAEQMALAQHDAHVYGLGFLYNGVRVDPSEIYVVDQTKENGWKLMPPQPTPEIIAGAAVLEFDLPPVTVMPFADYTAIQDELAAARAMLHTHGIIPPVAPNQRGFDDREQPPADLIRAAHLLHRWFKERNIHEWTCGPIMTRFQNGKDLFPPLRNHARHPYRTQ